MKKLSTFILSALFCSMAMAQNLPGVFKKATVVPVIDGVVDAVWAEATVYNLQPYSTNTPTLGTSGQTTWQGLWDDEGIYILVKVADDVFLPHYAGAVPNEDWTYDRPELYFDCNAVKNDGVGAKDGAGHSQFNFQFDPAKLNGEQYLESGVVGAFVVTAPTYIAEYFFPFWSRWLMDKDGNEVDRSIPMGFDVLVVDRDTEDVLRQMAIWSNVGAIDENWNNMNDAGLVTFEFGTQSKEELSANSMRVYPNPVGVGNELNVSLSSVNSKVAIYNAVGQKLVEKVATGNIAKFDVGSLRKGMYFVRLSDGTSQKFIR